MTEVMAGIGGAVKRKVVAGDAAMRKEKKKEGVKLIRQTETGAGSKESPGRSRALIEATEVAGNIMDLELGGAVAVMAAVIGRRLHRKIQDPPVAPMY